MPVSRERTRDIYEELPGCPKPPLIPLPDPDDLEALALDLTGTRGRGAAIRILHTLLRVVGFRKFQQGLTDATLEGLQRQSDLRRLGQCAPAISATVNLADDPRQPSPLDRAATLVLAARQFCSEVRSGTLPLDRHRGQPLEMGQYPNLFATSIVWDGRRPRIFKSADTAHVNLAVGRRLYSLDIGELDAELSTTALREALGELVERSLRAPLPAEEPTPALLTCASIATQRKGFRLLRKDEQNRQSLQALRHGLFTLCLDFEHLPATDAEAAQMAHSQNLANRWHHSSLQVVVFGNGKACAIFKFDATIDGNTMMRGAAELQQRAAAMSLPVAQQSSPPGSLVARELKWKVDSALIRRARTDVRSILDNQQATFEIGRVGKLFFKEHDIDPVPAFMLALHMTVAHFTGRSARIEQQLALSKYRCMGLTSAVVTTPEMATFSHYATGSEVEYDKAQTLLRAAIGSQLRACREARSHLPFSQLIPLFTCYLKGGRKLYVGAIVVANKLLGIKWSSDVIVSHPAIIPGATMLGRPGVRLPYLKYFGLHYRMLEARIIISMMPSLDWDIPNVEFVTVLEGKLRRLQEVIENGT